jgi:hypothetical protein
MFYCFFSGLGLFSTLGPDKITNKITKFAKLYVPRAVSVGSSSAHVVSPGISRTKGQKAVIREKWMGFGSGRAKQVVQRNQIQ